ncbi:LysR family transcriptional regulator [Aliamphritea hakodatensis]|uniref:LysR family transcriptional regulator n=1 Tax=Aliamphritea hakodatensis TaxID=2895352 RepID=UPI0022FDA7B8|nr:LysR family transcriptional regulator [Aliamphritea hakodatensis]
MNRNINLNWLRTFEATARYLSFTAASKELGLTQTAVSIQIKSLETKLGQKLFIRGPKSLDLTDIGKAYLPAVRESLRNLSVSTDGLFSTETGNTLVVRASVALIVWLAPKLGSFKQQYPDVSIKFITSIWPDGLDAEDVDIDIVLAATEPAGQASLVLSEERLVPVCGHQMAGQINGPADLLNCPSVHILGYEDHWDHYLSPFQLHQDSRQVHLQVDTFVAAAELVANNLGCAVVLERFARGAIDSGRPLSIVGDPVAITQRHYLAVPARAGEGKLHGRAFREWLVDIFQTSE